MAEPDSPDFYGEWLKQRRRTLDLTQAELAQRAGCSVFALRKIESGERRPSKQLARLLAAALELSPEEQETFVRAARGEVPLARLHLPAEPPPAHPPAPPAPPAQPDGLPANLPPLLGRAQELATLSRLLHDPLCRLLTLIGAGGIGKTRLAVEAASQQRTHFANGACFVSLAPLTAPAFVVPAIAGALGLALQGQGEPEAQLLHYLRDRQMLLVLDNFEHLLEAADLVSKMLAHAPAVKVLVTSRERLNLQNEWVFVIQGLPVPPDDEIAHAEAYTSVQLFVQSARRARVDFILQNEDREAVVAICRMVEGMPLGIELAAAWVPVLNCREIAQEIARSLDFLAISSRDLPDRQRSLRAVFNHSWKLLTPEERGILGRLAIFQGGFRRPAAEQIAGATLPALYALTSKSLLQHDEQDRYDLHEVVRQYAYAHFAGSPQREAAQDKHSDFYLCLLRNREPDLKGAAQREAIRELKEEIDNIRAAWAWAIAHQQFAHIGQALRSFGWLCNVGMLYREGIEQIEQLVQGLRAQPEDAQRQAVLGTALAQQGLLSFRQGKFDRARALYEESLAILRPLGDPALLVDSLVVSGVIMHLDGAIDRAQALMEEGLACARAVGDRPLAAYALFNLGYLASLAGGYAEGYEQMLEGLAMWREIGDPSTIALGLNYISPTAIQLGKLEEAEAFLQESLGLLAQVGDRWGMGTAYRLMGLTALAQGDPVLAQSHLHKSLDLFSGYIMGWDIARSLIYLGEATRAAGDPTEARRILLHGLEVAKEAQAVPLMLESLVGLAHLHLQSGAAATALELAWFVLAHPAGMHEVRDRARRLCTEAEAQLAPDQQRTARDWSEHQTLETVVEASLKAARPGRAAGSSTNVS